MAALAANLDAYGDRSSVEPVGETLQAIMGILKSHAQAIRGLEEWLGRRTPQATQASYGAHNIAKHLLQSSIDDASGAKYQSSNEADDSDSDRSSGPKHKLQTSEERQALSQHYQSRAEQSSSLSRLHSMTDRTLERPTGSYMDSSSKRQGTLGQDSTRVPSQRTEDVIKMEYLYKRQDDDIMSTTTEYKELPSRTSTLAASALEQTYSSTVNQTDFPHDIVTSTPASKQDPVKEEEETSRSQSNNHETSFRVRQSRTDDDMDTPLRNYSVASLNSKVNILESQISDWGEVIDELSDRLANQATVMRKYVSESLSKKVGVVQFTDDLAAVEARVMAALESKTQHLERRVARICDELLNKINSRSQSDERHFSKRESEISQVKGLFESLSDQCDSHSETLEDLTKDMDNLRDLVTTVSSDLSFYKHQVEAKNSQSQILLSLSDHLNNREADFASWKEAIKEVHTALNKQSEINTSLHHSMASLQKKFVVGGSFQHPPHTPILGRWRWIGTSGVYPKTHSCISDDPRSSAISFVSQAFSSDSKMFGFEKNKPYVLVTRPGYYLVMAGAFPRKAGNPPSIQLTIDEEPVLLYNSSGKSPSKHHSTIMTSAPKHPVVKPKSEGIPPWKTGSTLVGLVSLPSHCRVGLVTISTTPGKHGALSSEGILQLQKLD